jgi:hypothetical protein
MIKFNKYKKNRREIMKFKKIIVLPLLMLFIAACNNGDSSMSESSEEQSSVETSESLSETTSSEVSEQSSIEESSEDASSEVSSSEISSSEVSSSETSSEESSQIIYDDNNVYRLTGAFHDALWDTSSSIYVLTRVGHADIFEINVDMFINLEWKITINGTWDNAIAFSGTENLTIVDSGNTMVESAEDNNFKVNIDGNYTINLNTELTQRVLTIERNGDPLSVNPDINHDDWVLVGEMNSWTTSDTTYQLIYDAGQEVYIIEQFTITQTVKFKIVSSSFGWGSDRGFEQVINDPLDPWLSGDGDGNIIISTVGTYTVTFDWATRLNGGGTILITQYTV